VLWCLHAIDARRLQERRSWVVFFLISRPFGPRRETAMLCTGTRDYKEMYDFGHKPRPDLADDDVANHVMDGYNQVPELAGFREAVETYYACCADVCEELLDAVALSLDIEPEAFRSLFEGGHTSYLRLNAYPATKNRHVDSNVDLDIERLSRNEEDDAETPLDELDGPRLGVNRHFDAGVLTLLYQDPAVSSLQVNVNAHNDGAPPHWIDVSPVENALTVNVGDMLQVLSNGKYRAPEHRVLASPPGVSRVSAPFFYNPAYDAEMRPLQSDTPRYSPFSWGYFRRRRFEGDFADEGKAEVQIADFLLP